MRSKILALFKKTRTLKFALKKKISNKYTTIFGNLANKNIQKLNISFVVKKKIGNAVRRNKIKRRLKEIIINEATRKNALKFKIFISCYCQANLR